jgi:hypothetical protein
MEEANLIDYDEVLAIALVQEVIRVVEPEGERR